MTYKKFCKILYKGMLFTLKNFSTIVTTLSLIVILLSYSHAIKINNKLEALAEGTLTNKVGIPVKLSD